ncbi:double-strand-break repair protein rad21-like protein 1 [Brachionichthys hirsutus]|uniref:double-strand-break repair protein rad21-like protein 1 n=1 Tax=Brachionichthys hirsutus TaxID=412623 RepID=UPI003604B832
MTFYSQLFTSKRGPLAKIWLAAHWEKKLTKMNVLECNLRTSISDIISPQVKIGLRTTGHLLFGVVRIYSKKVTYLLTDCSDALGKIKIAFRPDQMDLSLEMLEAAHNTITLMEDFTAFDAEQPETNGIRMEDCFSLNQSRPDEITLKEDFRSDFFELMNFGDKDQSYYTGMTDISFQSLSYHGDNFGDEDQGFDLHAFLEVSSDYDVIPKEPTNEEPAISAADHQQGADGMEDEISPLNETTLVPDQEKAFALPPVAVTPNSERKKGSRKRKLIVDQRIELTVEFIRAQLSDWSDLVAAIDLAPVTPQLMQWKESGGAEQLMTQPCSAITNAQIKTLFAKSVFQRKCYGVCDEVEATRQDEEGQRDGSVLPAEDLSIDPDRTGDATGPMGLDLTDDHQNSWTLTRGEDASESTHPELPSDDSMIVHPSSKETQSTSRLSQAPSALDGLDFVERNLTRQAQKLLVALKNSGHAAFSLEALCRGGARSRAAAIFFSFLVLKKQKVLHLRQSAPYEDVVATPGPKFYD